MESSEEDRSSNAVRVWLPLGAVAAAITFIIAFIMRIPQEQTIAASASCVTSTTTDNASIVAIITAAIVIFNVELCLFIII